MHAHLATPAERAAICAFVCLAAPAWSAPLPTGEGDSTVEVTLEGGARAQADEELGADVLALDGNEGSYGHFPAPVGVGRLRNFRVDLKVGLDQFRAATVPFAGALWPERCTTGPSSSRWIAE